MYLAEITVIKPSNRQLYKACDEVCFLSKNLYNAILYIHEQNYQEGKPYIGYFDMLKLLVNQENPDYYTMNTYVGGCVAKQLHDSFKSFFSSSKSKKEGKHSQKVRPPRYKDKV